MHQELGQFHTDVCPRNLLQHYGKHGEIVYLLNDFDGQYPGRLKPEMYGPKAHYEASKDPDTELPVAVYKNYTYEDMVSDYHFTSVHSSHNDCYLYHRKSI